MRASVVIFRTLAQERCRSAADNPPKSKADPARSNRRSLECDGSGKGGRYARWATSRAIRASKLGSKESYPPKKMSEQKKPDVSATFRGENIEKPRSRTHTHTHTRLANKYNRLADPWRYAAISIECVACNCGDLFNDRGISQKPEKHA